MKNVNIFKENFAKLSSHLVFKIPCDDFMISVRKLYIVVRFVRISLETSGYYVRLRKLSFKNFKFWIFSNFLNCLKFSIQNFLQKWAQISIFKFSSQNNFNGYKNFKKTLSRNWVPLSLSLSQNSQRERKQKTQTDTKEFHKIIFKG